MLQNSPTSTFNLKKSGGYTPGPPLKGGVEGGKGREAPQFTFLATPLPTTPRRS